MKKHLLIIPGSLRKDSINKKVISVIINDDTFTEKFTYEIFDNSTLPLFNEDIEDELPLNPDSIPSIFRGKVQTADGILIVSPEYNWSIPGNIKNAIDWLSTNKVSLLKNKPIAITGASTGGIGTARMQIHLKSILFHLGAKLMNQPDLYIPKAASIFSEDGDLIDVGVKKTIKKFVSSFVAYIENPI